MVEQPDTLGGATNSPDNIRRHLTIPGLPKPTGPFAWSVEWGSLVFVSGIRGIDASTGRPADSDQERMRLIFTYLKQILEESGSALDLVLSTRVYVTDMTRHRPLVNEMFERAFGDKLPTRTIIEVSGLNQADSIEIEAVAVRTAARSITPDYQVP
ncbi:MAG: RidA family protein [Rubrobacteraceae bacterium]|uniref:RidA family protein n=1 Tax=Rubrobacter naiadicus TaxID=1392641 RepID=UPI00236081BB|nr:RidA family protein [Rubrobacter naiadicus]MBX6765318.1 RidA family protein [Rubrobacteraceae bacterium]